MASANFKAPRPLPVSPNISMDKDPEYLRYLNLRAEEEQVMRMLEKNLETC